MSRVIITSLDLATRLTIFFRQIRLTISIHDNSSISFLQGYLDFLDQEIGFAAEISKHMVTDISGLELHLTTRGHAVGFVRVVSPWNASH
jgi:hypothetical protein